MAVELLIYFHYLNKYNAELKKVTDPIEQLITRKAITTINTPVYSVIAKLNGASDEEIDQIYRAILAEAQHVLYMDKFSETGDEKFIKLAEAANARLESLLPPEFIPEHRALQDRLITFFDIERSMATQLYSSTRQPVSRSPSMANINEEEEELFGVRDHDTTAITIPTTTATATATTSTTSTQDDSFELLGVRDHPPVESLDRYLGRPSLTRTGSWRKRSHSMESSPPALTRTNSMSSMTKTRPRRNSITSHTRPSTLALREVESFTIQKSTDTYLYEHILHAFVPLPPEKNVLNGLFAGQLLRDIQDDWEDLEEDLDEKMPNPMLCRLRTSGHIEAFEKLYSNYQKNKKVDQKQLQRVMADSGVLEAHRRFLKEFTDNLVEKLHPQYKWLMDERIAQSRAALDLHVPVSSAA